jgi:hypothetical protein
MRKELLRSRQELGDEHEKTLELRREVCVSSDNDAQELCEIWEVRRRTQGDSHPFTLLAQVDLARARFNNGERDEAVELCFQVVHALPRTHPPVFLPAASMEIVAEILEKKGRLSLAVPLQLEALDMRRRDNRENTTKLAVKTLHMAMTLCYFGGNTDKAEDLFREAVERFDCIRAQTRIPSAYLLFYSFDANVELAKHLLYQGKLDDAKPLYKRVMDTINHLMVTCRFGPVLRQKFKSYMAACDTGMARLTREEEKRGAVAVSTCMDVF